jgi:thioredoxin reductase
VFEAEIDRVRRVIPHVHLQQRLTRGEVDQLIADHDFVVVAAGAQKPRTLPIPGRERLVTALDFLAAAKAGTASVGKRVVIIGAGNVGCDVAAEAARLGALEIVLLDVQQPASFGKEREEAERWVPVSAGRCPPRRLQRKGWNWQAAKSSRPTRFSSPSAMPPTSIFCRRTWPWRAAISRWTSGSRPLTPRYSPSATPCGPACSPTPSAPAAGGPHHRCHPAGQAAAGRQAGHD